MVLTHTYPDNEPGNYPHTELGKGNGKQRADSERSDAGGGHVQDSHKDVQSSKSERTVLADYEKVDMYSVLAYLDNDGRERKGRDIRRRNFMVLKEIL